MEIRSRFYGDKNLEKSFFELQRAIFPSIDIEWAYTNGLLSPAVIPFGVFDNGRAVSILNATHMDLIMGDSLRHAVQIGTVATHPEYTRQGLAKKLLLHVVEQCAQSDLTFLYANDSVMSFYPRFGFELRAEHSYQVELKAQIVRSFPTFQKWIPHVEERELLSRRFQSRTPISTTLGISDYASLATWHCLILYKEQLWISDDAEILMVCRLTGDTLQIYDIVAERLDEDFFRKLQWPGATRAVIHFVPDRFTGEFVPVLDNSDAFFIRGKLESEKGKIPLLAHT